MLMSTMQVHEWPDGRGYDVSTCYGEAEVHRIRGEGYFVVYAPIEKKGYVAIARVPRWQQPASAVRITRRLGVRLKWSSLHPDYSVIPYVGVGE